MTFQITSDSYVFQFGKYKGYKAVDVAALITVDNSSGLLYLEWLCEQEWFKHKDIVFEVIKKSTRIYIRS